MAKRGQYGFEKRQKELKRKKKQEEKLERRRLQKEAKKRAEEDDADGDGTDAPETSPAEHEEAAPRGRDVE
jgi:hypothetical protein